MGLIENMMSLLFGGGRNAVVDTVKVFREHADTGAARDLARSEAALAQFSSEFALPRRHWFDALIDGLNRIPRPAMALGTIGLIVAAMVDPIWFGERMTGLALVPEPLWWLLGAIVSFYFGARHQAKTQAFQQSIATTVARVSDVSAGISALRALEDGATASDPETAGQAQGDAEPNTHNPALAEWVRTHG